LEADVPPSPLTVERHDGPPSEAHLEALARLRIEVFREFPYLYEGSLEHERSYLRSFARSPRSTLVLARCGERVVGASTAVPLLEHGDAAELTATLRQHGIAPERVYYFGESVLERGARGHGTGNKFFEQREAAAREAGFSLLAFVAVERPADHPARPHDYAPHDAFWMRRGFVCRRDLVSVFRWLDVGEAEPTDKPMVFWLKELSR
jgi:GNAT superfamily N-acetyltransferase